MALKGKLKKKTMAPSLTVANTRIEVKTPTPEEMAKARESEALMKKMDRLAQLKQTGMVIFQQASDARKKYDWEWLTRDLYRQIGRASCRARV